MKRRTTGIILVDSPILGFERILKQMTKKETEQYELNFILLKRKALICTAACLTQHQRTLFVIEQIFFVNLIF